MASRTRISEDECFEISSLSTKGRGKKPKKFSSEKTEKVSNFYIPTLFLPFAYIFGTKIFISADGYDTDYCRALGHFRSTSGKEMTKSSFRNRLVFTDHQRRTLHAIFKENKRPSKEMQLTISNQLGLEHSTVSNFFMNARRRSLDKWQEDIDEVLVNDDDL